MDDDIAWDNASIAIFGRACGWCDVCKAWAPEREVQFGPEWARCPTCGAKLKSKSKPDLRPLIEMLLRYDRPVPLGIRHMLATMLEQNGGDGYLYHKLELVTLETKRRGMDEDLRSLDVTVDYRTNQKNREKNPAEATALKFDIEDASTVYRHLRRWKKVQNWLKGKSPTGAK